MDKLTSEPNSKKIWILLGLVVVIIIITIVAAMPKQKKEATIPAPKPVATSINDTVAKNQVEIAQESVPALKDAAQVVPNSINLVTKDNQVVNLKGEVVRTDLPLTSPQAPQQTGPLNKEELSAKVIKLDISLEKGISPAEFTVSKGAPISIAVSSIDQWTHIFRFEDKSLSSVAIGVSTGETRAMTFNAPTKAGEYKFYCDLPSHASRGEVGKMIVK